MLIPRKSLGTRLTIHMLLRKQLICITVQPKSVLLKMSVSWQQEVYDCTLSCEDHVTDPASRPHMRTINIFSETISVHVQHVNLFMPYCRKIYIRNQLSHSGVQLGNPLGGAEARRKTF